jgi:hypothetical protein
VGVLWITGGLIRDIPHREATSAFLAMNLGPSGPILTIFKNQPAYKLAFTNIKIFLTGGKTLYLKKGS